MMKALVKSKAGAGNLEFMTRPVPKINPDQVLIAVKAAGVCGTDISFYHWKETIARNFRINFPRILGHEFSGVIVEVGSRVEDFKPGDRVTANPGIYCDKCRFCAEGLVNVCKDRLLLGADLDGVFAEYVAVRADNVLKLPDNINFECGAVIEPLCVAVHAVEIVPPEFGDVAVITGAGAIGLLILMVLKQAGTSRVIVTGLGVDEERLALASSLGADTINAEKEDPLEKVMALTGGKGADVVFEAAGHHAAVHQAINLARIRGRICFVGLPGKPTEIQVTELIMTEKRLFAARAYERKTWGKAYEMLAAGHIELSPIITHQLSLEAGEEAFRMMDERQGLRILLKP